MRQSEYEQFKNPLGLSNSSDSGEMPMGTIVPERFQLIASIGEGIERIDYFIIFSAGKWSKYQTIDPSTPALYSETGQPSIWQRPVNAYSIDNAKPADPGQLPTPGSYILQTDYEGLYDHINCDGPQIPRLYRLPVGFVIPEFYFYVGPTSYGIEMAHCFRIFTGDEGIEYTTHETWNNILYTESQRSSIWRRPLLPFPKGFSPACERIWPAR